LPNRHSTASRFCRGDGTGADEKKDEIEFVRNSTLEDRREGDRLFVELAIARVRYGELNAISNAAAPEGLWLVAVP